MEELVFYPEFPDLKPIDDSSDNWVVEKCWVSQLVGNKAVVIRKGFETDGASIPRVAWRVIGHPFKKDVLRHALGHDALYAAELMTRSECDMWFLESMKKDGVSWWKRNAIWSAVRIGGAFVWGKHVKAEVDEARKLCKLIDAEEHAAYSSAANFASALANRSRVC